MGSRIGRRCRGHSLIEVVTALFVVTAGLCPVLLLDVSSYRLSNQSRAQALAYVVAQRQMESLKARSWNNLVTSSQPVSFTPQIPASVGTQIYNATDTRQLTGKYWVTLQSTKVKQITICVSWPSLAASGKTSQVCLDTLIAAPPGS